MTSRSEPPAPSGATTATKRLLRELEVWRREGDDDDKGIERLGPVEDHGLLEWQAVINGRGVGGGYDEGRWLLTISIPPTYPSTPAHPLHHAHHPRQRLALKRRNLPRPASQRVDASVQRAGPA
ncbi:ubiquitin-conjugating enzyme [Ophiocordyceps camponoti-floridani]|uniref:Ubiquitin-conjugating enzyme n=1 Tax=Ophiocordyceps camponoti-floridani TaxID=2030778 RepID=A0A8H4VGH2_9HYPO|nr:ubiquitin-conjugating enzyme [Ophiocordyceps camponoti-floridani]